MHNFLRTCVEVLEGYLHPFQIVGKGSVYGGAYMQSSHVASGRCRRGPSFLVASEGPVEGVGDLLTFQLLPSVEDAEQQVREVYPFLLADVVDVKDHPSSKAKEPK